MEANYNYITVNGKKAKLKVMRDGKWVEYIPVIDAEWLVPDENYPDTCSNCKFEFVYEDMEYLPKFCPECGAHMAGRKLLYK